MLRVLDENLNGYPSTQLTVMDKLHLGLWTMVNELNAVAIDAEWIQLNLCTETCQMLNCMLTQLVKHIISMAAISGQRRVIINVIIPLQHGIVIYLIMLHAVTFT